MRDSNVWHTVFCMHPLNPFACWKKGKCESYFMCMVWACWLCDSTCTLCFSIFWIFFQIFLNFSTDISELFLNFFSTFPKNSTFSQVFLNLSQICSNFWHWISFQGSMESHTSQLWTVHAQKQCSEAQIVRSNLPPRRKKTRLHHLGKCNRNFGNLWKKNWDFPKFFHFPK